MTESEKQVLRSLVAFAWADGKVELAEESVIEGLLCAFDASEEEEAELLDYARAERSLADLKLDGLGHADRELLLSNAALLTYSDGNVDASETRMLDELIRRLGFDEKEARSIIAAAREGAF